MIRTSLPFSTTTLLGLHQLNTDALVLDGTVIQVSDRRPRAGETQVLVNRLPKAVPSCTSLEDLIHQTLRRHHREIGLWVQRTHIDPTLLDRDLPPASTATAAAIGQFVRAHLIPRLRAEQDAAAEPTADTARKPVEDPVEATIQSFPSAQLWPRWFAFYHDTWYGLAPFSGQPLNGRFHLVWKDRAFIAMSRMKGRVVVRTYDQRLEEAICRSFQELQEQRLESSILYQRRHYRVLRSQKRNYFVCRQIPPYVVEGQDRALYLFPQVQVGVPITALEVDEVLRPFSARIMHAYRHMFAHSAGACAPICMPLPADYYARLYQLPLEEALLQHLEAARMTLCAGYHEGNRSAVLHDIRRLNLPRITRLEAQSRGLPVYPFYRK